MQIQIQVKYFQSVLLLLFLLSLDLYKLQKKKNCTFVAKVATQHRKDILKTIFFSASVNVHLISCTCVCSCFSGDQLRWLVFDHSIGSFGPFKALWPSHRRNKSSHISIIISTNIHIYASHRFRLVTFLGLPQWLIMIALQNYFPQMHFCDFKDFNLLTRVCHLQSHICPWLDPPSKLKWAPQVITSARFTSEWFLTRVTPTEQNNICIVRTG